MPTYEEFNTTALKINQVEWSGDVIRKSFGGGLKRKVRVGPVYGKFGFHVMTDKSLPGTGYGITINSMSRFDYYLDFFQRFTTGDDDVFVIDFRGKKYTVGLVDTHVSFGKERLVSELFKGDDGISLEFRFVPGFSYADDGSIALPDPPTGLTLDFDDCTTLVASWDVPPDITAPSVPVMTSATDIAADSITWNWNAATDDTAVTGYDLEVALDSGFSSGLVTHNLGNVLTYVDTGKAASTQYYARVRAHDAVPNNSAYSSSVNATTSAGLFLDALGHASIVSVGMRKLANAYAGQCHKERRISDNAVQDIGFVSNVADWASAATFKGASTVALVKWYDQSGNGHDMDSAATDALEPMVDTSSHWCDFDGSNDLCWVHPVDLSGTDKLTIFWAGKIDTITNGTYMLQISDVGATNRVAILLTSTLVVAQQNGSNNKYGTADTSPHVYCVVVDRSQAAASDTLFYIDGVLQTSTSDNTTNISGNFDAASYIQLATNVGSAYGDQKTYEFHVIGAALNATEVANASTDIATANGF